MDGRFDNVPPRAVLRLTLSTVFAAALAVALLDTEAARAGGGQPADPPLLAQSGGGSGGMGRGGMHGDMGSPDDRAPGMSRRGGDRDRMRSHVDEMDRLHRRMQQEQDPQRRRELRQRYREQMDQTMGMMGRGRGPGPEATDQERLRYMEQRMDEMERLMRHMWESRQTD